MLLIVLLASAIINVSIQQTTCPSSAPYDEPTIDDTSDDNFIRIETSGCPPFENPNWKNPGNAMDQNLTLMIPKTPKYATTRIPVGEEDKDYMGMTYLKNNPAPILGLIGVLMNGVLLYGMGSPCGVGMDSAPCPSTDPNAPTNYIDAFESESWTFDQCGGHPSNMNGRYHIHSGNPFMNSSGRTMCDLPTDTSGEHSVKLGWMVDGFAIYGQYSQGGLLPTQLDECHGHTHEIDGVMTYHYHMPTGFPYVIGCFKGCPKTSNNQMELNKFNTATYGCPSGQANDPDPLIETIQTSTTTSIAASSTSTNAGGSTTTTTASSTNVDTGGSTTSTMSTTTSTMSATTSTMSTTTPSSTSSPDGGETLMYSVGLLLCLLLINYIIV